MGGLLGLQGNDERLLQLSEELNWRGLYSTEVTHVLPAGKEEDSSTLSFLCSYVDE